MGGGLAYLTGFKDQPMRAGASITDIGAATYGVIGILAALYRRETTGEGDNIEAGLYETVVFWISQYVFGAQMNGVDPPPRGSRSSGMGANMGWGVYRLFPTKSGRQIFIAVTGNRHWTGLCDALGFADWRDSTEFNSNRKRGAHKPRIDERMAEAVAQLDYDDIAERLYKALVPFSPVNTPLDLVNEKHMNEGRPLDASESRRQAVQAAEAADHAWDAPRSSQCASSPAVSARTRIRSSRRLVIPRRISKR